MSIDEIFETAKLKGIKISFLNELIGGYRGKLSECRKGKSTLTDLENKIISDYLSENEQNEQKEKTSPQLSDEAIRLGLKLDKLSRENKELVLKLIDSMIVK